MIEPGWQRVWRERRLASDARAGRHSRAEARRIRWAFVKRSWAWLLSGVVLGAACTATAMLFIHGSFARGMVVGAAVVLVFGGLAVMVNQMTGTASLDMGALAETWTASELRPLRRNGWRIANHLLLRFGDIDHLLVGPNGVLIIETKWSAYEWAPGTDRFRQAIHQVKGRARDVRLWRPELRHASPDLVRPVLFLWGGSRSDAPKPDVAKTVDGVQVIYGITAARAWRTDLVQNYPAGEISEAELTAICRRRNHAADPCQWAARPARGSTA